jgi:hypothetical protein
MRGHKQGLGCDHVFTSNQGNKWLRFDELQSAREMLTAAVQVPLDLLRICVCRQDLWEHLRYKLPRRVWRRQDNTLR